ncbi:MAG: hypothetical protein M1609_06545, partial [Firmicutes bacterium]|nr:hypothetical protein [Bacillota bacterium]
MYEILETTGERAVLVGVRLPDMQEWQFTESMEELSSLADTAGAVVVRVTLTAMAMFLLKIPLLQFT